MKHPECVKGNHQWVIRQVGRSTEIYVCSRTGCDAQKELPPKKA